jgi:NDP-sugar pyrophosphorylase family protein
MRGAGIKDIGFNACHCAGEVHAWAKKRGVPAGKVVTEPQLRGTGGGVRGIAAALNVMNNDEQTLIVWNGDIVASPDLIELTETLARSNAMACLLLRDRDPAEAGIAVSEREAADVLSLPGHGEVVHKHPSQRGADARELGYCGIMAIRASRLRGLPENEESCIFRDLLGPLLASGERIVYREYEGFFSDLGTPNRFYQASLDALDEDFGGLVNAGVYRPVTYDAGKLWMHETAELGASVQIEGDVICGPGTKVRAGSRLTRCQVTESVVEGTITDQLVIGGKSAPLFFDS